MNRGNGTFILLIVWKRMWDICLFFWHRKPLKHIKTNYCTAVNVLVGFSVETAYFKTEEIGHFPNNFEFLQSVCFELVSQGLGSSNIQGYDNVSQSKGKEMSSMRHVPFVWWTNLHELIFSDTGCCEQTSLWGVNKCFVSVCCCYKEISRQTLLARFVSPGSHNRLVID